MPRTHSLGSALAGRFVRLALTLTLLLGAPSGAFAKILDTDMVSFTSVANRGLTVSDVPDVTGDAAVLIDADGKVLWSRDADKPHAMASITKLMTAVVALENSSPDAIITVGPDAVEVGQSTSGLRVGDKLPLKSLIPALLVSSGNDAAIAIAEGVAGGIDPFVKLMNDKAAEMGLKGTVFKNPHGLDAEGHLTTAADLAVLVRYAMRIELIRSSVALPEYTIDYGNRTALLHSTNELLTTYPGANGVKTGFTDAAGHCLASGAVRDGVQLYAVVLGATSASARFTDCATLLDWGFAHYRPLSLAKAGEPVAKVPVTDLISARATAAVAEDVSRPVFDYDGPILQRITLLDVSSPVSVGDQLGTISWVQGTELLATAKLVATDAVAEPSVFEKVSIVFTRVWRSVFGGSKVAEKEILADTPIVPDPSVKQGE